MKWTQRQKITGAVLTLAASAFGVDRFFLPTDSDEAGDTDVAQVPAAPDRTGPVVRSTRQTESADSAGAAFARRLELAAAGEQLKPGQSRDAFSPPVEWYASVGQGGVRTALSDPATTFRSRYRLTAVMRGAGGRGVASISGPAGPLAVRVGMAVDGFVLKSVADHRAVLSDGAHDVVLELDRSGLAAIGG